MPGHLNGVPSPILAIDSCGDGCGVAVIAGDAVLATAGETLRYGHAAVLPPMIDDAVRRAGCGYGGLAAVAVTAGPGSFTGVRVGLSAARGIALAIGRPCIGVTVFEAVAAEARSRNRIGEGLLLVAIDTRRDDVYAQTFDDGTADGPAFVASRSDILAACPAGLRAVTGSGAPMIADFFPAAVLHIPVARPDPVVVGRLAAMRLHEASAYPPTPLYLRAPEVSLPVRGPEAAA